MNTNGTNGEFMIKNLRWTVQLSHRVALSANATDLLCVRTSQTQDKVATLVIKGQFYCCFNCCSVVTVPELGAAVGGTL